MKFEPKTEKQIKEESLWPEGTYPFEVIERGTVFGREEYTDDTISKSGNEMIRLIVRVFHPDNPERFITLPDYLIESMLFKVLHCCEACGLTEKYETGELRGRDFIGKSGYLRLGIEKDKTGDYPDKNRIIDYVKPDAETRAATPKERAMAAQSPFDPALDDTIPF